MTVSLHEIRRVAILGTGHALPVEVISSAELDQRLNHHPGTIERISGVRQRYFASRDETAAKLAGLCCITQT